MLKSHGISPGCHAGYGMVGTPRRVSAVSGRGLVTWGLTLNCPKWPDNLDLRSTTWGLKSETRDAEPSGPYDLRPGTRDWRPGAWDPTPKDPRPGTWDV